jgi:hypothetical protein
MNEYGDWEWRDCSGDFLDLDFWVEMREEDIWHNPDNLEAYGFMMFWDEWHYGGHHDYNDYDDYNDRDCEDVSIPTIYVDCDDYMIPAEGC